MRRSVEWMLAIKNGGRDPVRGRNPYTAIAEALRRDIDTGLVTDSVFAQDAIVFVPIPSSSIAPREPYHWPAREMCRALLEHGLGSGIGLLLRRERAVKRPLSAGLGMRGSTWNRSA
jgi:hypothetical protein